MDIGKCKKTTGFQLGGGRGPNTTFLPLVSCSREELDLIESRLYSKS